MHNNGIIGVCLSTVHLEDRFDFISAINKHAVQNGYRLIIFNSCADLYENNAEINKGESAVFKLVPYDILSAVIIFPNIMYDSDVTDELVRKCREKNIPIISIDKEMDDAVSFSFAYASTFEKLCRHIIEEHNVKNAYMMAGFKDNVYSEERIGAFKKVLEENNLPFIQDNIGYGCFWEIPTLEVLDRWFVEEKREVPEAIICANDFMAITVSSYLQDMGVNIPQQCIVTGFDGIKQTEYLPPKTTTCKQDFNKMSELIIDTVNRMKNGESISGNFVLDFSIVYSQSCGCMPIDYNQVTSSIRSLIDSLRLSDERQKMLCNAQISIPKISDIYSLPKMLTDKFHVGTCVFALNECILKPEDFETGFNEEYSFSRNVSVIYRRFGNEERSACVIPTEQLIPDYDEFAKNPDPIIVYSANFSERVMGYCVFQPETDKDAYCSVHNLMCIVNAALGDFHSRMQIKAMNKKLMAANDELERLSRHDYMTGLFNRRGFFSNLDESIREHEENSTLVMISADLDGLKYINDTFGHSEGDNAIITVAKALLASSLQNEICARFGGDEFCVAVIIRNISAADYYESFSARFKGFIDDYNKKSHKEYTVSASIGYHSETVTDDVNTEKIINIADEKMYLYKVAHKKQRQR